MRLTRLKIDELPGIDESIALDDLAPGVNLITGPNAVGKSSLVRALGYLIGEPTRSDPKGLSLFASFQAEAGSLSVRRLGQQVLWELDGRPAERPDLPAADQLHCYLLRMEDLLDAAGGQDAKLVSELRKALGGGHDLDSLKRDLSIKSNAGRKEAHKLQEAVKKRREVNRRYEALRREEAGLDSLNERIAAARGAARRARSLEQASALLEARRELALLEKGLEEFPPDMERLQGDEIDRLRRVDELRESTRRLIEAAALEREAAAARLAETGLAAERPERVRLDSFARELQAARRGADRREERQRQLETAGAAAGHALRSLGGSGDPPRLDPAAIAEGERVAADLHQAELRRRELLAKLGEAEAAPQRTKVDANLRAAAALREWLSGGQGAGSWASIGAVLALVGGLVALATAFLSEVWPAAGAALVAFIGALLALFGIRSSRAPAARRSFEETGIAPPESWSRALVEARLGEIETERAELQQRTVQALAAEEHRRNLAYVDEDLLLIRERVAALAARLGFDPSIGAASLDRFVRLISDYEKAHLEAEAATAEIARLDREKSLFVEHVAAFLGGWSPALAATPAEGTSLESLEVSLADLRRRLESAEAADRERRDAEREGRRQEEVLYERSRELESIFREAGLEPGDRIELSIRLGRLEDWRSRRELWSVASIRVKERGLALEGDDELLARVESADPEDLQAELRDAGEQAACLDSLQQELADVRARLRTAGSERLLEEALEEQSAAQAALHEAREDALTGEAACFLLEQVKEEYRSEHEPDLLRDARERFRSFTHHEFDLELDDHHGFMARDLRLQASRSLLELSSATRMQLLLAARLAWARKLERGRGALPFFLDEALTTSDERRFGKVAASLERLAREEGRQVFYLAARRHEVALWERATGSAPHHVDMAALRFIEESPMDFELPEEEALPSPEGLTSEGWATALGLPPIDPAGPEGKFHAFHLLRDQLPLLHQLMETWRVGTLGQLETLLGGGAAEQIISDPLLRLRVEARCLGARVWAEAWRRGRGRPVSRSALDESGLVSERFLDRLAELAKSFDGDALRLVAALREKAVRGYGDKKVDDLEQWLDAEGYISSDRTLDPEERRRATLTGVASRLDADEAAMLVEWLEAGQATHVRKAG